MDFKTEQKDVILYDKEKDKLYNGTIIYNPEENIYFKLEIEEINDN